SAIRGICQVHDDEVWISIQGSGFAVYNTMRDQLSWYQDMERFKSIDYSGEKLNAAISIQEIDLGGRHYVIMVGRYHKILIMEYDKEQRQLVDGGFFYFPHGRFFSNFVEKQPGEYWFGGNRGMYKFDVVDTTKSLCDFSNFKIKIMKFDNRKLQAQTFNSVAKDKDGVIWAGTAGGILRIEDYNSDSITKYKFMKVGDSVYHAPVNTIFFDSKNKLWVGTKGMGLCSYNDFNDSFRRYTEEEGMLADGIEAIIEDDNNCLWVTSNKGLYCIKEDSAGNVQMKNYVYEDGLQGNIFCLNSIHRSSNGTLYVGGYNGLNIIRPNKIKMHRNIPVTKLSHVTIYNEELVNGERLIDTDTLDSNFVLKLTYKDYGVKIGFANYSYSNSH
ncbi:MAG: hypothetical protein MI922_02420, partial [Bacteroidales bacterium]|nr:hypothetical protein [Bacteroidales bacterium]